MTFTFLNFGHFFCDLRPVKKSRSFQRKPLASNVKSFIFGNLVASLGSCEAFLSPLLTVEENKKCFKSFTGSGLALVAWVNGTSANL
jgi:hypothetical protein